jgi:hypothetical protein
MDIDLAVAKELAKFFSVEADNYNLNSDMRLLSFSSKCKKQA